MQFEPMSLLTTSKVIREGSTFRVVSPADPFLEKMQDAFRVPDQVMLAALALRHDPLNVAAHVELSIHLDDEEAEDHMRAAVTGGEAIWGPVIREMGAGFDWSTVEAIEPLFDAYWFLGEELMDAGDPDGARNAFSRIIELAPSDPRKAQRKIEEIEAGLSRCAGSRIM